MTVGRRFGLAVAISLVVWAFFSWPLPKHVLTGIPSSDRNVEKYNMRTMISGDHLQLLYHFWLAGDMVRGETPFLHNPYEFNAGDDAARYKPDPYYVPFSLVYAAGAWLGGRAFGWNFAGFISLMLTFFLTWQLVRRYVDREWVAVLGALIGVTMPYRWITLLTGSPTGFAMALVPALLLGLDVAVRDSRPRGGLLAGVAVFLAYCSDLHVFFFLVLAIPLWCVMAFVAGPVPGGGSESRYGKMLCGAFVTVAFVVGALALNRFLTDFSGTDLEHGRVLREVARFSPVRRGLFSWANMGVSNHVFFGSAVLFLLLSGAIVLLVCFFRGRRMWGRAVPVMVLLGCTICVVVALALGVNGPRSGVLLSVCRKIVPRYSMIRQPVKIYCLMPSLLAVAGGIALSAWCAVFRRRVVGGACCVLLVVAVCTEFRRQISPTICVLLPEQEAYRAVADDAIETGEDARVLVLPLWPGDSHYTSLYQYYASLYRIRMVNGYSPVIDNDYYRNVFLRFESANQGALDDSQIEELREKGIHYLLFHEGPFPEKVSPFPSSVTLKRLLNHPRLKFLEKDGLAWAFRVLQEPEDRPDAVPRWRALCPARRWEAERACGKDEEPVSDELAGGGYYVSLEGHTVGLKTRRIAHTDGLRWMMRVRGRGVIRCSVSLGDRQFPEQVVMIRSRGWTWRSVPIPSSAGDFFTASLDVSKGMGDIDLDLIILAAGDWLDIPVGGDVRIPAPCFFHAGYTDRSDSSVVLLKDREADRTVLYGPNVPLKKGMYVVRMFFESDAPAGTVLGSIHSAEGERTEGVQVVAGEACFYPLLQRENLPISLQLVFSRLADMKVLGFTISRLK